MRTQLIVFMLVASSWSQGAVYKCTQANGRLAYQSHPCDGTARAEVTDIVQRATPKLTTAPAENEENANEGSKQKSWIDKRAEEREARREERKKDHDERVQSASDQRRFEQLIFKKQVAIGMTREQVIKAWGSPSSSAKEVTAEGEVETLTFTKFRRRMYTGKNEAVLKNGKVISFKAD